MREFLGYDMNANFIYLTSGEHSPRHAISTIGTRYIVTLGRLVFPISKQEALIVILAMAAALNVTSCLLVLLIFVKDRITSLLFTAVYCFCYANITIFSVPETYVVSVLMVFIYFLHSFSVDIRGSRKSLVSSGLIALASLNNISILSLFANNVHALYTSSQTMRIFVKRTLLASVILVATYFSMSICMFGKGYFSFLPYILNQFASFKYFFSLRLFGNVFAGFTFYSIISPVSVLEQRIYLKDFLNYFANPVTVLLLVIYVSFLSKVVSYLVKNRDMFLDGVLWWLASMYVLYVYFNPWEPIIFAPLILPGLMIIYSKIYFHLGFKYKHIILILFLMLLVFRNIGALRYP
jgi:hypothetical protein